MTTIPPHDQTPGSPLLQERLRQRAAELPRTERIIAEHLARIPLDELPFINAEQVARATGTSDASVIRTARSLGFSGLPELKRHATRPQVRSRPPRELLTRRLDALGTDTAAASRQIFVAARELLEETESELDPAQIERALDVIGAAGTLWCIGVGTAGAPALHLADTLGRAGVATRWTRASGFDLSNELISLHEGDAIVLFHASAPQPDAIRLIEYAERRGVPMVLVCGTRLADAHAHQVAAALRCVGTASRLASWSLGAHLVADILSLAHAARHAAVATQTSERLGELRRELAPDSAAATDASR